MFTHYLKIALRNLLKNKVQSAISIIGLMVGFVCITLSAMWIRYEMTYDTSYPNAQNIYLMLKQSKNKPDAYSEHFNSDTPDKLLKTYPEIKATVNVGVNNNFLYNEKNQNVNCTNIDSSFFSFFNVHFIIGDKSTCLNQPDFVILSESEAIRLYGSASSAFGKTLKSYSKVHTVTGIIKDFKHSNLSIEGMVPFEDYWATKVYIELKDNVNKDEFFKKLYNDNSFFSKFTVGLEHRIVDEKDRYSGIVAAPISQLRYKYNIYKDSARPVIALNNTNIIILISISLLLFFSALFNYTSLFISAVYTRAKEFNLRRAIGSKQIQLLLLLLTEFSIMLLLASFLSICIFEILRPVSEQILEINVELLSTIIITAILILLLMLISALISCLVWFSCVNTIKRNITKQKSTGQKGIQKILLIIQFVISIFFLFISTVMQLQLRYVNNKDLGLDTHNIIEVKSENYTDYTKLFSDAIIQELQQNTNIEIVSQHPLTLFGNGYISGTSELVDWEDKNPTDIFTLNTLSINYEFFDLLKIKSIDGRLFSKSFSNENEKVVINEKLATKIDNPIGKTIKYNNVNYEIIGIVNDFMLYPLKHELPATMMTLHSHKMRIYIRYVPNKINELTEFLDTVYKKHGISSYSIEFVDDKVKNFFKSDTIIMRIFNSIALFCIIISIFGVYSLTSYNMQRRKREVAIRKVMGASVSDIIRMFFKEYVWLVIIASIIAIPPAYYIMDKWLQGYANRINIEWWLIAGIIISILLIVTVTVLRQIVKVANSNPAEVIKYE